MLPLPETSVCSHSTPTSLKTSCARSASNDRKCAGGGVEGCFGKGRVACDGRQCAGSSFVSCFGTRFASVCNRSANLSKASAVVNSEDILRSRGHRTSILFDVLIRLRVICIVVAIVKRNLQKTHVVLIRTRPSAEADPQRVVDKETHQFHPPR